MKLSSIDVGQMRIVNALRTVLLAATAGLLVACGGGGVTSTPASPTAVSTTNPRALPAEYLARKAVAYSPFRTGNRDTETITAMMVKEDLDLLIQGNFKLIRLFDSSDKVAKLVLDVIVANSMDMKVQLGAYVNTFETRIVGFNPNKIADIKAENEKELARAVKLANDYPNIVLAVSVGNETLVNWSTVPIDAMTLAGYISKVRSQLIHKQPVTTDDNFLAFANPAPKPVLDQVDFLAIHLYPNIDTQFPSSDLYWNWKQLGVAAGPARAKAMMDASMVELRRQYQMVRTAVDGLGFGAMPIAITETGWNAVDKGAQKFRAHPVNQKMFYERLEALRLEGRLGAGPVNIFYFEAFDEPWKQGDDGWGLFNVARKARYVIQNLYPSAIWENASLTDADAVYFTPPVANAAITSTQYTLYSDAPGATLATGLRVDAFDGNSVSAPEITTASPPEGVKSIEITPQPKDYGWGLIWGQTSSTNTVNLSAFEASGNLKLWVKTSYAGKIELGLSTLDADGDSHEVYLQIGNGEYGYCNTNSWCQVSVPLQAFKNKNPEIDYRFVISPFIIADRYSFTGKPLNSNITTKLNIDGIHWSR